MEAPTAIAEIPTQPAPEPLTVSASTLASTPNVKKLQFVEIDFNDVPPPSPPNTTEPSIAFRPFKLGIGQSEPSTSAPSQAPHENVFRFQKSF